MRERVDDDENWCDRVTSIVHKIGNTVLASVGYVRQGIGEPMKIDGKRVSS